jgi:putative transposase
MGVARSSCRYQSCRDDGWLRERLLELAREHPRFGYRRLHVLLSRDQVTVKPQEGAACVSRAGADGETEPAQASLPSHAASGAPLICPCQEWSVDFASDVTAGGQRLRVLSVLDSFTKQNLALEVDTSFPSRRVTRVLDRAIGIYGRPQSIRCDNGPEITSRHFLAWAIERKIAVWQRAYNCTRPHSALGYRTPNEFAQQWQETAPPVPPLDRAEGPSEGLRFAPA